MTEVGAASPALSPVAAAARPISARTRWLLEAPVLPALLRLSFPNFLNLAAISALVTFDGLFLGRLGPAALAGVSLVFPFVMAVHHVANSGMGGAVSSAVARALGGGEREAADTLAAHAFALAIGLAILFSTSMLIIGPVLFRWMGGSGDVLDAALAYSTTAFGGIASVCMLSILANVVRASGNMILPAAVQLGAVVLHVALSPFLIFGWGPAPALGVAGSGLSLVLSFGAGAVALFVHLRGRNPTVRLSLRGVRYRWEFFREFFRVGIPGMINVAITNLTVVVLTGVAGHLGRDAQLGYAMGARLEYILIPLAFVFGTALVPMVGTNWGARQYQRARRIAWTGGAVAAAVCGAVGWFFAAFPTLWMGLFTTQDDVLRVGTLYLHIVAPVYVVYGFGQAVYCARQGVGDLLAAVLANAARLVVSAGAGLAAALWLGAGPAGAFAAIACGFVLYALLNAWILVRTRDPAPAPGAAK